MNRAETTITLTRLTTGYHNRSGNVAVTADINATLRSGELTCLLGPNGAGKSTLLRTLCGFQPPLSGEIAVDGRRIADISPAELARIIGVVLTERLSINNMTVEQLVAMGRAPYTGFWGRLDADDLRAVDQAIALTGIDALRSRMIQTLSDGERQKTMIAKALAQQTPVIFLDEPTAFLDYPSKVEIIRLLHKLAHDDRKIIFLSTHDLELALQIADSLWLIRQDGGLTVGIPEDLAYTRNIEHYFRRAGVEFDPAACAFRMSAVINRRIEIAGEPSVLRSLTEKALLRNGIEPVPTALPAGDLPADTIQVTPDEIIYRNRCFSTISALLAELTE